MVLEIGAPKKARSEGLYEIRLFGKSGEHHEATIRESHIRYLQTKEATSEIPHCKGEISLSGTEMGDLLQKGTILEIWAAKGPDPEVLLIRARVDYVEGRLKSEKQVREEYIGFQGRSVAAVIVDSPHKGQATGSLDSIVTEIVKGVGLTAKVDSAVMDIDIYIDTESCFAALLLLGAIYGGVVRVTREGGVTFEDVDRFVRRVSEKPPRVITQKDILSMEFQQGKPIRFRRGRKK